MNVFNISKIIMRTLLDYAGGLKYVEDKRDQIIIFFSINIVSKIICCDNKGPKTSTIKSELATMLFQSCLFSELPIHRYTEMEFTNMHLICDERRKTSKMFKNYKEIN